MANSLEHIDDELHLNVKAYRYDIAGRQESGIASQYLLTLEPGDTVRIYPHRNARFHLPDDPHIPVILIAEGSGILKMAVSMAPCEINWEGFSSSSADVSA